MDVVIDAQKHFDRNLADTRLLGGGGNFIALTTTYKGKEYRGILCLSELTEDETILERLSSQNILVAAAQLDETKGITIPELPTPYCRALAQMTATHPVITLSDGSDGEENGSSGEPAQAPANGPQQSGGKPSPGPLAQAASGSGIGRERARERSASNSAQAPSESSPTPAHLIDLVPLASGPVPAVEPVVGTAPESTVEASAISGNGGEQDSDQTEDDTMEYVHRVLRMNPILQNPNLSAEVRRCLTAELDSQGVEAELEDESDQPTSSSAISRPNRSKNLKKRQVDILAEDISAPKNRVQPPKIRPHGKPATAEADSSKATHTKQGTEKPISSKSASKGKSTVEVAASAQVFSSKKTSTKSTQEKATRTAAPSSRIVELTNASSIVENGSKQTSKHFKTKLKTTSQLVAAPEVPQAPQVNKTSKTPYTVAAKSKQTSTTPVTTSAASQDSLQPEASPLQPLIAVSTGASTGKRKLEGNGEMALETPSAKRFRGWPHKNAASVGTESGESSLQGLSEQASSLQRGRASQSVQPGKAAQPAKTENSVSVTKTRKSQSAEPSQRSTRERESAQIDLQSVNSSQCAQDDKDDETCVKDNEVTAVPSQLPNVELVTSDDEDLFDRNVTFPHGLKKDDLIWAKGYLQPYWPGRLKGMIKTGLARVDWCPAHQKYESFRSSKTYSDVPVEFVEDFVAGFARRVNGKRRESEYKRGVVEAVNEAHLDLNSIPEATAMVVGPVRSALFDAGLLTVKSCDMAARRRPTRHY
ncbi:hypothetical protein L596_004182 [Steinernema carpocapsae]|uniref:PWWP domain-containing protein n=2 Tax=Steinernema carpocapsae TaxID=34508 RepID=A0A4U8UW13_STECR|nr:hypothetical protein L596_004182 [Steinernema carpocapsae]